MAKAPSRSLPTCGTGKLTITRNATTHRNTLVGARANDGGLPAGKYSLRVARSLVLWFINTLTYFLGRDFKFTEQISEVATREFPFERFGD